MKTWYDLEFWKSDQCKAVMERLNDSSSCGRAINPLPDRCFAALDSSPLHENKVVIVGQDPYPDPRFATGRAFDIPGHYPVASFPSTLKGLFTEYCSDLGYPMPTSGDLTPWCRQGVLLWNAYPTCFANESLSHKWPEWRQLTFEIIDTACKHRRTVFCFLGREARSFAKYVDTNSIALEFAHPSGRAYHLFKGCRMFSTINAHLRYKNLGCIDWRLP